MIYLAQQGFEQFSSKGYFSVCLDSLQGFTCSDLVLQQFEVLQFDLQHVMLITAYVKTAKNVNLKIKFNLSFNSISILP